MVRAFEQQPSGYLARHRVRTLRLSIFAANLEEAPVTTRPVSLRAPRCGNFRNKSWTSECCARRARVQRAPVERGPTARATANCRTARRTSDASARLETMPLVSALFGPSSDSPALNPGLRAQPLPGSAIKAQIVAASPVLASVLLASEGPPASVSRAKRRPHNKFVRRPVLHE